MSTKSNKISRSKTRLKLPSGRIAAHIQDTVTAKISFRRPNIPIAMSPTIIYGLLVAVLILGPLIILHEFGHYFLGKLHGVKVLEFGFGFPPRIFGIWTGAKAVAISEDTKWDEGVSSESLNPGQMVDGLGL